MFLLLRVLLLLVPLLVLLLPLLLRVLLLLVLILLVLLWRTVLRCPLFTGGPAVLAIHSDALRILMTRCACRDNALPYSRPKCPPTEFSTNFTDQDLQDEHSQHMFFSAILDELIRFSPGYRPVAIRIATRWRPRRRYHRMRLRFSARRGPVVPRRRLNNVL
jgi:hypothetical protein